MQKYIILFANTLFLLCSMVLFTGCPKIEAEELPSPAHYFVFKNTTEGTDFFINNTAYNIDSITFRYASGGSEHTQYKFKNGYNRFIHTVVSSEFVYINFGNASSKVL